MLSYVRRDLLRNPRRTLASMAGVVLGVGLFSGVLFFIDGSGASMTKRAIAPLTLDMQRVSTSPLGGDLRFSERIGARRLRGGQSTRITLVVTNDRAEPANEVVINGEPPAQLTYMRGTTTLNGRLLGDVEGRSPLAQGLARSGLNIGTVRAGETVRLTYAARARRPVGSVRMLRLRGRISSREDVVPEPANAPAPLDLEQLQRTVSGIPGVAAADTLEFVDLPPGSLSAGGRPVPGPVRLFAFDRLYVEHYPSIRITSGSLDPRSALLSAEAARALRAGRDAEVALRLPDRRRVELPVSGTADLSRAKPLFSSRSAGKLEDFLYVPNAVVVSPETFERSVIPAFRAARARLGNVIKSLPTAELDVLVRRSRLDADPGTALAQTRSIARQVRRIAPGQDNLIDNISNTLEVARDDSITGKRMFFFLGLPGVLLAAFLAAYAGGILASTERRERANLRIRGAHRGHLVRMLAYKTLVLAGVGSVVGVGIGFVAAMIVLGGDAFFEAAAGDLVLSGLIAGGVGMVTTALALYIPGRLSLSREVSQERREMQLARLPAWRRLRLDFALLAVAAVAEVIALAAGAFDPPSGSVSAGEAVSLPSRLLVAPLIAWFGGMLLAVRIFMADHVAAARRSPATLRLGDRGDSRPQPEKAFVGARDRDDRRGAGCRARDEPRDLRGDLRRREGGGLEVHRRLGPARDPEPPRASQAGRFRVQPPGRRDHRGHPGRVQARELGPDRTARPEPQGPGGDRAGELPTRGRAVGLLLRRPIGRSRDVGATARSARPARGHGDRRRAFGRDRRPCQRPARSWNEAPELSNRFESPACSSASRDFRRARTS